VGYSQCGNYQEHRVFVFINFQLSTINHELSPFPQLQYILAWNVAEKA
jgi:hypothetical protein